MCVGAFESCMIGMGGVRGRVLGGGVGARAGVLRRRNTYVLSKKGIEKSLSFEAGV